MAIVKYNKKYTETLKEMLERFRLEYPEFKDSRLSYAGRLDPLAQGLMIILSDDDLYNKEQYLKRNKVYEVECLLGFQTDSFDVLGILQHTSKPQQVDLNSIKEGIKKVQSVVAYPYPPYSSRTVSGKPLYQWAKEGRLAEITIPKQSWNIKELEVLSIDTKSAQDVATMINKAVSSVKGEFRQHEILTAWNDYFQNHPGEYVYTAQLRCAVGSGTYVRSIVHELGQQLGTGACCIKITRTHIEGIE